MKKIASLTVGLAAVAMLLSLFIAPVFTAAAAQGAGDAPDGKEVFLAQKCNMCHAVSTVGIEAKVKSETMQGPDLVDLERDPEWIAQFVTKEIELDGEKHKKEFKGSDEELDVLISWLLAQKTD